MTGRSVRLVAAAAFLGVAAAALAAAAPLLPAGLAAACAPEKVARELLAALLLLVLVVGPAFLADDPERGPEVPGAGLAVLAAVPAVVALAATGGVAPGDLLPAGALLLAAHLASSAALRLDSRGARAPWIAAAAVFLAGGLPIALWGIEDLGGWKGAAAGYALCPLLAVRDVGSGWAGAGPALLLLVGIATVLRFGVLLRGSVAAAGILVLASTAAAGPDRAEVLVIGAPREGPFSALVGDLRKAGRSVVETPAMPSTLPPETSVIVFAVGDGIPVVGPPSSDGLDSFVAAGGRVVGPTGMPPLSSRGGGLGFFETVDAPGLRDRLLAPGPWIPHPADRPVPGVEPALFRVPFPGGPRSLPAGTAAFLAVAALASVLTAVVARRRGFGTVRTLLSLLAVAALASVLLFAGGLLGPPVAVARLRVVESTGGPAGRVTILHRFERRRPGSADPLAVSGVAAEVLFESGAAPGLDGEFRPVLPAPGTWGILAEVRGAALEPFAPRRVVEVPAGGAVEALAALRRDPDPEVARAGWALAALLRPRGAFRVEVGEGEIRVVRGE